GKQRGGTQAAPYTRESGDRSGFEAHAEFAGDVQALTELKCVVDILKREDLLHMWSDAASVDQFGDLCQRLAVGLRAEEFRFDLTQGGGFKRRWCDDADDHAAGFEDIQRAFGHIETDGIQHDIDIRYRV